MLTNTDVQKMNLEQAKTALNDLITKMHIKLSINKGRYNTLSQRPEKEALIERTTRYHKLSIVTGKIVLLEELLKKR